MPSYTESAILKVVDQATAPINKINAALKQLFATAKGLKSTKIDFGGGLPKTQADVRRLTSELQKLQAVARNIRLNINPGGIAQASRQIAQLRAQAARPLTLGRIAAGLGVHGAAAAVGRQAREGLRDTDIGRTSLDLKELSAERRRFVDEQIRVLSRTQAARPGGATWSLGTISQQMSEMLGVVKIGAAEGRADFEARARQATFLSDQNLELARTLTAMGVAAEQASEESIKFGKALEIQGNIYDKQTGKFDPTEAAKQYNLIRSLIPAIGKEMTGSNFLQLMKHLQVSRFGLSAESMALAMAAFEEEGTRAATGLNQMIRGLSGRATKAALEEQRRLGLITTTTVPKEVRGRKVTKEVAGAMDEEKAKKLREFPQRYINEELVPALKQELMLTRKFSEQEAEAKLNDAAWVSAKMGKVFSDRSAQERATAMILRRQENEQFLKDWRSRQATMDTQRRATQFSVAAATTSLQQQLQSVFGEAIRGAFPVVSPLLGGVTETLRSVAEEMNKATQGDVKAQQNIEAKTSALLTGGAVAMLAKGPIQQVLSAIAPSLGITAGVAGALTAESPAARSLSLAGITLNAAGDKLSSAADAMRLAGLTQGAGGLAGNLANWAGLVLRDPKLRALALGAGLASQLLPHIQPELMPPEEQAYWKARKAIAEKEQENVGIQQRIAEIQRDRLKPGVRDLGLPNQLKEHEKALQDNIAALAKMRDAFEQMPVPSEIAKTEGPSWKSFWKSVVEGNRPREFPIDQESYFALREAQRAARKAAPRKLPGILGGGGPLPVKVTEPVPLPRPRPAEAPRKLPAILGGGGGVPSPPTLPFKLTELETSSQNLTTAATSMATSTTSMATTATTLSTTPSAFELVFGNAGRSITNAATTAAEIISAGASNAGSQYGNAAAAAILAATSNMNINVNATIKNTSTGTDTGTQKSG